MGRIMSIKASPPAALWTAPCDTRHAAKYLDRQEDEDHLLAAAWNLLWAIEMRCKKPECVDTPWRDNAEG